MTKRAGATLDHATEGEAVPLALRHHRPGWRDPRILVGLAIIAGSVLLGVKVLASADDTVGVWAVGRDLPAGTRVQTGDLERVQVRFTSSDEADRYLAADDALPDSSVLRRAVGSGELLPRAALSADTAALVEVPLSVEVDAVPSTVREGSVVDVWVTPQTATTAARLTRAELVLDDVVVVRAPRAQDTLAPEGTRQVVVGVDPSTASGLGPALGRTSSGRVVLTKQG